MNKNDCSGCSYYPDMEKIKTGVFAWYSTSPHPCTTCKRFPSEIVSLPDNYTAPQNTIETTYDILGRAR